MKKTLTLLALVAALMPMMPHAAKAETIWVTGISLSNPNNYTTAVGWYDATKDTKGGSGGRKDNELCWAAASSNIIAWWQDQQDYEIEAPQKLQDIWDKYRDTFANVGGHANLGLSWWLDGSYSKDGRTAPLLHPDQPSGGGYYSDSLVTDIGYAPGVRDGDLKVLEITEYSSVAALSATLVNYIRSGYGVELSCITPAKNGHSITLWGVDYNEPTQTITGFYVTDSDDYNLNTLTRVSVSQVYDAFQKHNTLAWTKTGVDGQYTAWKFTVLNSRLSNDYHYFNILDEESGNIIMKQSVEGSMGYTLTEGTQEVKDIIFDGSRGTQDRLLTVEGEHTAERLRMEGSGTNTIDVTKGGELVVEQITGGQNLTKTGAGALEIKGGTHTGGMDIQAGDVHNFGKLGDVTLANGGSLVNEGTTGELTVGKGSVAEIVRSAANSQDGAQAFALCTVEEGGVLTGSGNFGQVVLKEGSTLKVGNGPGVQVYQDSLSVYAANLVFTIDDAYSWKHWAKVGEEGWNSSRYSTIEMNGNALTLKNPEFTMALGSDILERAARTDDLDNVLGMNIYITMDLRLIAGLNSMSDPYKVYEGYEDFYKNTHFMLSEDDAELVAKGLEATFTPVNMSFYVNGQELYMQTGLNVTLAKAPAVPEPTTSTLSLLALASLCARRRRK